MHLCISSKFNDRYKNAINLVQNLINTVYDEYKKYCEKHKKTPVSELAVKIEEGLPIKKNNLNEDNN